MTSLLSFFFSLPLSLSLFLFLLYRNISKYVPLRINSISHEEFLAFPLSLSLSLSLVLIYNIIEIRSEELNFTSR